MAQGIRQAIHSITSLAVPIETDSNASAEGRQKEGEGRQGGEEEGLAKKDTERRQRTERARGDSEAGREACELHINPVGSDPSQRAPFSSSRKTPIQNHGNTEEWTSYAPNPTLQLTKAVLRQEIGAHLRRQASCCRKTLLATAWETVTSKKCVHNI